MERRIIDENITLIPYYPNDEVSLVWYQDPEICKQVDNIDYVYDIERLRNMYNYLNTHGECYYIEYRGKLIGDISLRDNCEIAIVITKEFQNKHIGRKCVSEILKIAENKKMTAVKANIYSFNEQSRRMFQSLGFEKIAEEWYEYKFK
ncbi:MAG: GNAT family N-acetyltransferase [Clostridia bacterium]|nr:GNAT family N-acetyltransferase [Clostridia bacterium]